MHYADYHDELHRTYQRAFAELCGCRQARIGGMLTWSTDPEEQAWFSQGYRNGKKLDAEGVHDVARPQPVE